MNDLNVYWTLALDEALRYVYAVDRSPFLMGCTVIVTLAICFVVVDWILRRIEE